MNKRHNPDDNLAFKPPRFLFYYMQRIFIWGEWSIAHARYYYRRELHRYQQQQAHNGTTSDDNG